MWPKSSSILSLLLESCVRKGLDIVELLLSKGGGMEMDYTFTDLINQLFAVIISNPKTKEAITATDLFGCELQSSVQ